jgi:hypothetical protein
MEESVAGWLRSFGFAQDDRGDELRMTEVLGAGWEKCGDPLPFRLYCCLYGNKDTHTAAFICAFKRVIIVVLTLTTMRLRLAKNNNNNRLKTESGRFQPRSNQCQRAIIRYLTF